MPQTHEQWLKMHEGRMEAVRTTSCPICKASPGQSCMGKNGSLRKAPHGERRGARPRRGPRPQPTYDEPSE